MKSHPIYWARARLHFIRRWRAFNAEKGSIRFQLGAGDSIGDSRERLIGAPIPFESLRSKHADFMVGILPLVGSSCVPA